MNKAGSLLLFALLAILYVLATRCGEQRAEFEAPLAPSDQKAAAQRSSPPGPLSPVSDDSSARNEALEKTPATPGRAPASPAQADRAADTRASFWCRVQDQQTGLPIGGAKVSSRGSPSPFQFSARALRLPFISRISGADGWVELRLAGEARSFARVDAEGFGPIMFRLSEGHDSPNDALVVHLQRGAQLVVSVVGPSHEGLAEIEVRLSCAAYELNQPQGLRVSSPDVTWSATTDARGRCVFVDLPVQVALRASASLSGESLHREPAPLLLQPGERREVRWNIGSGGILRGVLSDQDGRPIAQQALWITREAANAKPERERIYFYASDERNLLATATSDADGAFEFDDLPAGNYWVGPALDQSTGSFGAGHRRTVAPVGTRVGVKGGGLVQDLRLRVDCELFLRGRIEFPGDTVVRYARIRSDSELGFLDATLQGDGFLLGPLVPVLHQLRASGIRNLADSAAVDAWPGDEDVLLELLPGASLACRFVDAMSGAACAADLLISCASSQFMCFVRDPRLGPLSLEGLAAGSYDLTARTADGRVGVLRGIELGLGEAKGELVIRVRAGSKLHLGYEGPSTYAQFEVLSEGAIVAGDGLRSETTSLLFIPPGKLLVQLRFGTELIAERELQCEVGEEREVLFVIE